MDINRPNLDRLDPAARDYIIALEAEIEQLRLKLADRRTRTTSARPRVRVEEKEADFSLEFDETPEPAEPPTSVNVITATTSGIIKRTPRHLYNRQRRGGMGIFDLDTSPDDPPVILAIADQEQSLILVTNLARAFRLPVSSITESPVRSRGESLAKKLNLPSEERLAAILPDRAEGYVALVSQRGMVRLLRHHVFGEYMKPGTSLYDLRIFGPLAGVCWSPGDCNLFIATRQGRGICFSEKLVAPQGTLGIRLVENDSVIGITSVYPDSRVFLLSADGKGTLRLMEGFAPNKSAGASGKIALATDHLVCAHNVDAQQDVFIITKLSKIIRFRVDEIPPKDGVVQGVVCISLRADEPVAVALNPSK